MKKSFLIFSMLLTIPLLGLAYWACGIISNAETLAAFSKIEDSHPPLTADEVTKLLGQPSHIEQSETTGLTGEVYYYPSHKHEMKIVFINGTVFHAEYTPEKKF